MTNEELAREALRTSTVAMLHRLRGGDEACTLSAEALQLYMRDCQREGEGQARAFSRLWSMAIVGLLPLVQGLAEQAGLDPLEVLTRHAGTVAGLELHLG